MKTFLIILGIILAALIVILCIWFFVMKANGKCPLCMLKKLFIPTKLTIDISGEEEYNNDVAQTPPMGWSSWNTFRNHIDQDLIMETARAMKNSGLAEAGYQYVNLDDCWQSSMRDADGKLQGDLHTFSRGIPALIEEINSLGLKAGLYSSNGSLTCEDMPASLGTEELDAKTVASWGCEFFKYDFCHNKKISSDCPLIEYLIVNRPKSSFEQTLYPEDAEFTGRAKVIRTRKLPSKKAIGFISHGSGSAEFRVNADISGEYIFTVVYAKTFTRKNKYLQVIVNGTLNELFFPISNGFSDNGRAQLKIKLQQGENTIRLQNPVVTWIDSQYIQYKRMGDALKNAYKQWAIVTNTEEKPITYSICEWGTAGPHRWGAVAGSMWRTTHDILAFWARIMMIYEKNVKLYEYSGPGHWNDPDMLEVGVGKLTPDENKSHFALWCMMAAPLMLGNDIRKFVDSHGNPIKDNEILKIVTNRQLIAIDQDALGKAAKRLAKGSVDILARPLVNGDIALCFFNKSRSEKQIDFKIDDLNHEEYLDFARADETYEVHNLFTDDRYESLTIKDSIGRHAVQIYRIKRV
jgi:hypothetical protein